MALAAARQTGKGGIAGTPSAHGKCMEFHIRTADLRIAAELTDPRARQAIEQAVGDAVAAVDPSALADIDPLGQVLRVATCVDAALLAELINQAGFPLALAQVTQLPSICCGGCSG